MRIINEIIQKLDPCKDRYDNYFKFYGDKALTKAQFLGRCNITQSDKEWVSFRLMTKAQAIAAACDIAESVLHIFEAKFPNDDRPRKAIAAAKSGDKDVASTAFNAASYASKAASYASKAAPYAYYAAYYASNAAYYAAYAKDADRNRSVQEKLIRKIILKHWKG